MFFPIARSPRLSFGVSIAAYTVGTVLAGIVTAHGFYRVTQAIVLEVAPAHPAVRVAPVAAVTLPSKSLPVAVSSMSSPLLSTRQASMVPTQDRWSRGDRGWPAVRHVSQPMFGTSSRVAAHWSGNAAPRRDWDYEERSAWAMMATYRTMCVRLCDGFYWPVSYATSEERFERDASACANSCGGQARLFVYRNPGSDIEDMQDLQGRPYRRLSTAFLYRTQYVSDCKCQPHPWEAESKDRHQLYALAAARSKGNKQVAKDLEALQQKVNAATKARKSAALQVPAPQFVRNGKSSGPVNDADLARRARAGGGGTQMMGLGADTPRRGRPAPQFDSRYDRDPDWRRRVFDRW